MSRPSESEEQESLREQVAQHEQRIVELEVQLAFTRKTNDDLDEVVRRQGERLDTFQRQISELFTQLAALDESIDEGEIEP